MMKTNKLRMKPKLNHAMLVFVATAAICFTAQTWAKRSVQVSSQTSSVTVNNATNQSSSQDYEVNQDDTHKEEIVIPLSAPGKLGELEVHQIYGGVKVIGYEGQEIIVTAMQKKMKSTVKMKNGLRKIQNNSMSLSVEESDNRVEVHSQYHGGGKNQSMDLVIKVPRNFNLKLSGINDGYTVVENVNGEFEISNVNNDITLNQVSGSAVVDTVNGEIKATFKQVTPGSQMVLTSFNGDVDLSLPSNIKADFRLKTTNGDIYTGFDIEFDTSEPVVEKDNSNKSYKVKLEKWVSGSANGGGTEIMLKSHSGDLILRSND